MYSGDDWLAKIAARMKAQIGKEIVPTPERITIRELLRKYNYDRRGIWINEHILRTLSELGIRSVPGFEDRSLALDELISIELSDDSKRVEPDPTHRVGMLPAARNKPLSVSPDDELSVATTIMMFNDYSQLPVMQNSRNLKGIISWKSIGARKSLSRPCNFVRDCMDRRAQEVDKDTPLFDVIGTIVESGYVLVRDKEAGNTISGIVTASDLSNQFVQLAGPFLFAGQIEGHLRNLVGRKIAADQIKRPSIGPDVERVIRGPEDLSLGDYCRLLSNPQHWESLDLSVDRGEFVKHLDAVRKIRNNIMHFRPERISPSDLQTLRDAARFFEEIARMGVM